jgi:threonine dehydrogenase-like Zn-dependent dehydrogenase
MLEFDHFEHDADAVLGHEFIGHRVTEAQRQDSRALGVNRKLLVPPSVIAAPESRRLLQASFSFLCASL